MNKSIVLTENSRITVRVIDLGRKPGALVYLWKMEEYVKPTNERRTPLLAASLIQSKPSCRSGEMVPGQYVLESAALSEKCFEIKISPE